jgi:hypothetical protein
MLAASLMCWQPASDCAYYNTSSFEKLIALHVINFIWHYNSKCTKIMHIILLVHCFSRTMRTATILLLPTLVLLLLPLLLLRLRLTASTRSYHFYTMSTLACFLRNNSTIQAPARQNASRAMQENAIIHACLS